MLALIYYFFLAIHAVFTVNLRWDTFTFLNVLLVCVLMQNK